jgi:hypothetical protein
MADLPPGFRVVQTPKTETPQSPALPAGFRVVQEKPSVGYDMAAGFASGVPEGAAETLMLPVSMQRIGTAAGDKMAQGADYLMRAIFGMDERTPEMDAKVAEARAGSWGTKLDNVIGSGQDYVRGLMDKYLYEPQTTPGEFTNTIGQFVAPGALPSKAARNAPNAARMAGEYATDLVGNVVLPGLLSEGAGQLTEGSDYEGVARAAGALTGNLSVAAGRAYNAPESVIRRATTEMSDADWARAQALQNNSTGVRLTGPEAIAQARDGASALPNIQRVVEGSIEGRARTGPFFAQRPGQVDNAVNDVLDAIAPQSVQPSTLGPRAAETAQGVIDSTRQNINAQTRPLYQQAESFQIDPAQFAPIAADPRFQSALARLRANPDLAPDYAGLPDNSVKVVDAVTKDMLARGEAMANKANPLYGPELAAKNSAGGVEARNIARDPARGGSADYDAALSEQTRLRREVLEPVEYGPVGRVAAANNTQGAGDALLPQNPLTGSGQETADAVAALVAKDPTLIPQLVRQNLADRYSRAATETMEGGREFSGAKFHKSVAGNPQREEVLNAVLNSLPGNSTAPQMTELLDVLQATGRRKPIGSATEFNRSINVELGDASPVARLFGLARSLGASFVTNAGDATRRAALRNNLDTLAEMFIDPQSVDLLRAAVNRGAPVVLPEAAIRTGAQTAPLFDRERGPR